MDDPNLDEPVLSNLLFADSYRTTLFPTRTKLLHSLKWVHQRPRFQSRRLARPLNQQRYILQSRSLRRFRTTTNRRLVRGMLWESSSGALERKDCVFFARSGERTPHSTLLTSPSTDGRDIPRTNRPASRQCCTTKREQNQIWIPIASI